MAPSFDVDVPQRSLVRIPESGEDKTLKPICLEIAQITSFSEKLNEIINFDFSIPPEQTIGGTITIVPTVSRSSTTEVSPNQRQENLSVASEDERNIGKVKRGPDGEINTNSKKIATGNPGKTASNSVSHKKEITSEASSDKEKKINSLTEKEKREKYERLQSDKSRLEEENTILEKKLQKFREIIHSRSKLKEFQVALKEMDAKA